MITTQQQRWLRGLYIANMLGAGGPGLLITIAPQWAMQHMFWSPLDPTIFSILGSIWLAIGLTSALGLAYPTRLMGIFVVQLLYKTIWLTTFVVPAALANQLRPEALILVGIFVFLIGGVLLIVPAPLLGQLRVATPQR
jgi:hypothetical protein